MADTRLDYSVREAMIKDFLEYFQIEEMPYLPKADHEMFIDIWVQGYLACRDETEKPV